MTTEEAINILDPATRHDALMKKMGGVWNGAFATALLERAQAMGLEALHSQTPLDRSRWEGCWNCNNPKVREMTLRNGKEYCPGCGKPLTAQAWAELEKKVGGGNGAVSL